MPFYTQDWTTPFADIWMKGLSRFVGKDNVLGLEVGCFEGRSSAWFLDNILTGGNSTLSCVDRCFTKLFYENMKQHKDRYFYLQGNSLDVLSAMNRNYRDFVYVDACECGPCTATDGAIAFRLLKVGGILIFDGPRCEGARKDGIDAFLLSHRGLYKIIHPDRQLVLEKTCGTDS